MSTLTLFPSITSKPLKWWEAPVVCSGCKRVTYRPPLDERSCGWCHDELLAVVRA